MPWAHTHIVAGPLQNGSWRVEVAKAGRYAFRLRRWPKESGLRINEHADHLVPPEISWHPLEPAKIVVTRAKVRLGKLDREVEVPAGVKVVEVVIENVPAGVSELQTWLLDDEGKSRGALYVEVERLRRR